MTGNADWPELRHWDPDYEVLGPLTGGHRNQVVAVLLRGERRVARRSRRSAAALEWEIGLLEHLATHGVAVPSPLRTTDRERLVGSTIVLPWVGGREPANEDDWYAVAAELGRLHRATVGYPQRPGFRTARELVTHDTGGDVDVRRLPDDVAATCRSAWAALPEETSVVHGDPSPGNIRLTGERVTFLDWDECRVDSPDLDLAALPIEVLPAERRSAARTALAAWEAASAWVHEPEYARRRLAAVVDSAY